MMDGNPDSRTRLEILISLLGVLVLSYIAGAYTGAFRVFPYSQVLQPYFAPLASPEETGMNESASPTSPAPWQPTWHSSFGVIRDSLPGKSNALTLYASGHRAGAVLIDRRGRPVHKWNLPYRQDWSPALKTGEASRARNVYWRRVHLFANGDLLALYTAPRTTPQGFGLVKVDSQSRLIWRYDGRTHHDFDVEANGTIYVLVHRMRDTTTHAVSEMPQLPDRILADELVRLSPDGREQARVSLLDVLARSPYRDALQMHPTTVESPGEKPWDVLHTNSVSIVGEGFADEHSFADPGDLLLSFRTQDLIALFDPETRQIVWATRGAWWQPTDADPLADGDILVFDSNGHGANGLPSRILKFDPRTEKVHWSYTGTENDPFWAREGGTHQPLDEGEVLVTSPMTGEIKQVDRDGTLRWLYRHPVHQKQNGRTNIALIWDAQRISTDTAEFSEKSDQGG